MRSKLIKIGNSIGILIPASLTSGYQINDEVEINLDGKCITVEPVHALRSGWFTDYKPNSQENIRNEIVETECKQNDWVSISIQN
jgi:antitoxin MazE